MSRITKLTKKFAQRFLLLQAGASTEVFRQQAGLLQKSTDTLCQMVRRLRCGPDLNRIEEENGQLHQYEGEATN